MNTLYIEPFSGLSGDMFLGSLCGLLDAYSDIVELPKKLSLHDTRIEIAQVEKNGIVCKHINVVDLTASNMHQDHGHHRHLSDIIAIIDKADIPKTAKSIAKEIFLLIGEAESQVHDIHIEKIHFHEISGVDSIVDIVGSAILIDQLDIGVTYSDPICLGYGMVSTQHGQLPIPAPATAKLLEGMPCFKGEERGERTTPTGAAILRYLNPIFESPPLAIEKSAYGPGKKDFVAPNVLRLSLGTLSTSIGKIRPVFVVETNIDDCSPELLGDNFQQQLLKSGALDFTITQALMKKSRPGYQVSALVKQVNLESVCDCILENTTAIGVRFYPVERKTLDRSEEILTTDYGKIRIKVFHTPLGTRRVKAEYSDLKKASQIHGIPIIDLKRSIERDE